MRKIVGSFVGFLVVAGCLAGCQREAPTSRESSTIGSPTLPISANSLPATARESGTSAADRQDPLGAAHRAYQKAYDTYVRSLRESGPQTMETLQALAEYQKNYQLYLMLKNADMPAATPGQNR